MKALILVNRFEYTDKSTVGKMYLNGKYMGFTLEDKVRREGEPKIFGETAIPSGVYKMIINRSNRFSAIAGHDVFLPLLLDVEGFSGVRIHAGNFPADTLGCVLLSQNHNKVDEIENSRIAFDAFMAELKNFDTYEVEIVDSPEFLNATT